MLPLRPRVTKTSTSLKSVPSQDDVTVALTLWVPAVVNVVFRVATPLDKVVVDPAGGGWPSTVHDHVGGHSPLRVAVKVTSSPTEGDVGVHAMSDTPACADAG